MSWQEILPTRIEGKEWTCPDCRQNRLMEVRHEVVTKRFIENLDFSEKQVGVTYYPNVTTEAGEVTSLVCVKCGKMIARSYAELKEKLDATSEIQS